MVSLAVYATSNPCCACIKPWPSTFIQNNSRPVILGFRNKEESVASVKRGLVSYSPPLMPEILRESLLPLAASAVVILSSSAGII